MGEVRFSRDATSATARIRGGTLRRDDHVFSLLLVDAATGRPVPLDYNGRTEVVAGDDGAVTAVTVLFEEGEVPAAARATYLVDTQGAARGAL